jgi:hypothetical protein
MRVITRFKALQNPFRSDSTRHYGIKISCVSPFEDLLCGLLRFKALQNPFRSDSPRHYGIKISCVSPFEDLL